jgi:superfamily II RNA helicase
MQSVFTNEESLRRLSPESYFKDEAFITKQNVRSYESALKEEFMTYVESNDERVNTVIDNLGSSRAANSSFPETSQNENRFFISQVFALLQELKKNEQLPVIFFSFERALCERLAHKVISCLKAKEKSLGSKGKREEKFEQKKAKAEKQHRDKEEVEVMRKTGSAGHDDFSHQKMKTTAEASSFLVDDPPPDNCSFAGKGVLDAADAQVIVDRLVRKKSNDSDSDERFKEGLRRGVSYHHAGMSTKQRSVVEMLFRKKFVRVIFATGTLALGIHMPCKTVVFANDSVFLNTLQYHQISGRAGRRGYDLIGHVIFFGIPQAKIQRLMTVSLPRIIGNFPLNVSLVLRLLLNVNTVENREVAMNQVLTLLQNPLICKNQPELDLQLKHHFLFSVELLVRQVCQTFNYYYLEFECVAGQAPQSFLFIKKNTNSYKLLYI